MATTNFKRIGFNWLRNQNLGNMDGLSEDDIRFSSVKIIVDGNVKWFPFGQLGKFNGEARKVNFTASKNDDDLDACVQTTKDTENVFRIKLYTGIIEGFNSTMKLPLIGTGHADEVGEFLIFDPSKPEPEILRDKMTLSVTVSKRYGDGGASTFVYCSEKNYQARFECDVLVKGLMLEPGPEGILQHKIVDIINGQDAQELSTLTIKPNCEEVKIKMTGEVELRWGYEQNMHVQ